MKISALFEIEILLWTTQGFVFALAIRYECNQAYTRNIKAKDFEANQVARCSIFFDHTDNGQKHILVYRMLIAKLNNPNDKEKPLNKYMKTCTYVKHDRN